MVRARGNSWCAQRSSISSVSCRQSPNPVNKENKEDDGDNASDLITNKLVTGQKSSTTTITTAEPTDSTTSSSFEKSSEINHRLPSKRLTRRQKTNIDVSYDEGKDQESNKDDELNSRFSAIDKGKESDADFDCQSNCLVSEITSKTPARFNRLVDSPKKQFKCNVKGCTRIYKRLDNFNEHLAKHRRGFDAKPFICDFKGCDRRFGSRFVLKAHLYQHSNKYKCKIEGCNRSFSRAIYLNDHLAKHRHGFDAKLFTCNFDGCDRRFGSRSGLRDHINKHTNKYKCTIEGCNRSYTKSYGLIDHLAKHQHGFDAKLFVCDFKSCDRRFGTRSGLLNHSNIHKDKYKCLDCEKRCISKYDLHVHRQSHTGEKIIFKCPIDGCDRQFNSRSAFLGHKAQHQGKYECQECGKRYQTNSGLNVHLQSHSNEKLIFKCPIEGCDCQFSSRSSLYNHKALHLSKYECKECDKRYRSMLVLKEHQRIMHTGEKPFKCKVEGCDRSYGASSSLTKHLVEHKDTYRCQDCGKRCQSKMRLENHRRSHDRDLQWKCDVKGCGRRFKSRNGFNYHKARHTGQIQEKQFKCEVEGCGKEYDTRYGFILHNNEHQGKFFRRKHRNNNSIVKEKKLSKNLNKKVFKCEVEGCDKEYGTRYGFILHNNEHQGKFFRCRQHRNDNYIVKEIKLDKDLNKRLKKKQSLTGDKNKSRRSERIKEAAKRSPIKRASKEKAIENMRNQFDNKTASKGDDDSFGFSSNCSTGNSSTDEDEMLLDQNNISTVESSPEPETKDVSCQVNLDNADAIDKTNLFVTEKCSKDNSKSPTQQFKCNLKGCNRSFPTLFSLQRHKRRHQGRCRCKECWNLKFNRNKHRRF